MYQLMKKVKLFLTCLLVALCGVAYAQSGKVTGTVTDSKGEPVAGVSVAVEGTTLGVTTCLRPDHGRDHGRRCPRP